MCPDRVLCSFNRGGSAGAVVGDGLELPRSRRESGPLLPLSLSLSLVLSFSLLSLACRQHLDPPSWMPGVWPAALPEIESVASAAILSTGGGLI